MKDIIIIGAGGHASVVIDIIESMKKNGHEINIKGLIDDNEEITEFMGYPILGKLVDILVYTNNDTEFVIAIGNNEIRRKIAIELKDLKYFTAIHPTSIIGTNVSIGNGTVVMPRSVINVNSVIGKHSIINSGAIVVIGKHSIINSGAIVEHDNKIGNFTHISPGAVLAGGVTVGNSTQIGANSVVIQCLNIGSNSIVGAGSTVIRDIESNVTAVGTPAKVLK